MNWLIDFSIGSTRYEDRANFDRASHEAQFSVQEKRQILCIVKEVFFTFFPNESVYAHPAHDETTTLSRKKKPTLVAILVFIFKPYQRKTLCRYSRLFENSAIPKLTTDPPIDVFQRSASSEAWTLTVSVTDNVCRLNIMHNQPNICQRLQL